MDTKLDWVHDLVKVEEQMEETGLINYESNLDPERTMIGSALAFLSQLRSHFQEAVDVFNEVKQSRSGNIKIYGIAKTHSDFMLFRNGFKLIFSLKQPGVLSVRTHYINPTLPSVASMNFIGNSVSNQTTSLQYRSEEDLLEIKWGPFNETLWTFKNQTINLESTVKHYLTKFIHDSANIGI